MHKLRCTVQNYEWGRKGSESEVAQLVNAGKHVDNIDASKPYAELWMGVHSNGMSRLAASGKTLTEHIKENPQAVGSHELGTLQYLFKVLSVRKALSVQSHPTKEQAVELHSKDPKNYPDANHKPEMAIALTDFQLLCGFRPSIEAYDNIKGCPALLSLIGDDVSVLDQLLSDEKSTNEAALQKIFTKIWSSPQEVLTKAVDGLMQQVGSNGTKTDLDNLLIRLNNEYPGGDVGVFAPLLLNYFSLKPGEATFLGPNRPHAYLFGDCIECMACSDNTIRAGLTPKYKDIDTLCSNLQYTMTGPPFFKHSDQATGIRLYAPPVPEFAVQQIKAGCGMIPSTESSSLVIVVGGSAQLKSEELCDQVRRGDVIFLEAVTKDLIVDSPSEDFLAFRAYTPKP